MSESLSGTLPVALAALAGIALGVMLAVIFLRSRRGTETAAALAEQALQHSQSQAGLQAQLGAAQAERGRADADIAQLRKDLEIERQQAASLAQAHAARLTELEVEAEALRQQLQSSQTALAERQAFIKTAHEALEHQFRTLAGNILDHHSQRFAEQNQQSLGGLLEPLRERLGQFQLKVETLYVDESKERSALKAQVQELMQLNRTLSDDAKELASALRGSAKRLGNWGELILERVLEASGLRRDHEYLVQDSRTDEDGQRRQPDVVIRLPEGRCLVVDSKLSLLAYERYALAHDETARDTALREHLLSVRSHIKALSEKRYQTLYDDTLDFVLMFIPVEPAFITAITHDEQLFTDAWESNVLLVSPSTLLFVVRTVAHLWRQEARSRNAQEIAHRGAELYDRLSGFIDKLDEVGAKIGAAQSAWTDARKKLAEGRGNVIRQAEMLRELGVHPAKQLPADLVSQAIESDETPVVRTRPH
ncbi:MAG: DNA recombination protein RmuC [Betaproteobacteria bacterium]